MKMYLVSESQLKDLITAANKYWALESGGVDNWSWYGESCCDFLEQCERDAGREFEDFEELTEYELTGYPEARTEEGD